MFSVKLFSFVLLFLLQCSTVCTETDYFMRNAKWVRNMSPSGGALVTGRGGFRPGFVRNDWRQALAEPSFGWGY